MVDYQKLTKMLYSSLKKKAKSRTPTKQKATPTEKTTTPTPISAPIAGVIASTPMGKEIISGAIETKKITITEPTPPPSPPTVIAAPTPTIKPSPPPTIPETPLGKVLVEKRLTLPKPIEVQPPSKPPAVGPPPPSPKISIVQPTILGAPKPIVTTTTPKVVQPPTYQKPIATILTVKKLSTIASQPDYSSAISQLQRESAKTTSPIIKKISSILQRQVEEKTSKTFSKEEGIHEVYFKNSTAFGNLASEYAKASAELNKTANILRPDVTYVVKDESGKNIPVPGRMLIAQYTHLSKNYANKSIRLTNLSTSAHNAGINAKEEFHPDTKIIRYNTSKYHVDSSGNIVAGATPNATLGEMRYFFQFPYAGAEEYGTYSKKLEQGGFLGLLATALSPEDFLGIPSAIETALGHKQSAKDIKIQSLYRVKESQKEGLLGFGKFYLESPMGIIGTSALAGEGVSAGLGRLAGLSPKLAAAAKTGLISYGTYATYETAKTGFEHAQKGEYGKLAGTVSTFGLASATMAAGFRKTYEINKMLGERQRIKGTALTSIEKARLINEFELMEWARSLPSKQRTALDVRSVATVNDRQAFNIKRALAFNEGKKTITFDGKTYDTIKGTFQGTPYNVFENKYIYKGKTMTGTGKILHITPEKMTVLSEKIKANLKPLENLKDVPRDLKLVAGGSFSMKTYLPEDITRIAHDIDISVAQKRFAFPKIKYEGYGKFRLEKPTPASLSRVGEARSLLTAFDVRQAAIDIHPFPKPLSMFAELGEGLGRTEKPIRALPSSDFKYQIRFSEQIQRKLAGGFTPPHPGRGKDIPDVLSALKAYPPKKPLLVETYKGFMPKIEGGQIVGPRGVPTTIKPTKFTLFERKVLKPYATRPSWTIDVERMTPSQIKLFKTSIHPQLQPKPIGLPLAERISTKILGPKTTQTLIKYFGKPAYEIKGEKLWASFGRIPEKGIGLTKYDVAKLSLVGGFIKPTFKPSPYKPPTYVKKPITLPYAKPIKPLTYPKPIVITPKYQQPIPPKIIYPKSPTPKYPKPIVPKYPTPPIPKYVEPIPPTYPTPLPPTYPKPVTPKYPKPVTPTIYPPVKPPYQPYVFKPIKPIIPEKRIKPSKEEKKREEYREKTYPFFQKFYTERFHEFPSLTFEKYPRPFTGPEPIKFKPITFKTVQWIKKEEERALGGKVPKVLY